MSNIQLCCYPWDYFWLQEPLELYANFYLCLHVHIGAGVHVHTFFPFINQILLVSAIGTRGQIYDTSGFSIFYWPN